ncbi:MAG: 3,4-dihydroxy-2-butanone-4-phosphate synthase [Pseudomonadota bacterium]|nr:3,4-dihydroxy-2-butanone-4-phosphate synthase [Pseudomonadota bacterium]
MKKNISDFLSPIPDVIQDIRNGRMVVVVDDEDRENEGDLIVAAQMATPDTINFMAKYGRGLICLAMTGDRIDHLGLSLMSSNNRSQFETAFTTSIEAREGVTTGISASDRARTIAVAIDPSKERDDIVTPGHVFPLRAQDGGTLVRTGHTEAAVDLARLAGLNPSGVICEIMNEDGTMARLPDLVKFAQFHGVKVATIADLIAYRLTNDSIVERSITTRITREHGGDFKLIVYRNRVSGAEHLALVKGEIGGANPVLVRMHAVNILDDMIHDSTNQRHFELESSIRAIGEEGAGVVVIIREPWAEKLSNQVRARHRVPADPLSASAEVSVSSEEGREITSPALRDFGVGAQILVDLGVKDMVLLTNRTRAIKGLEGFGLSVFDRRPIENLEE